MAAVVNPLTSTGAAVARGLAAAVARGLAEARSVRTVVSQNAEKEEAEVGAKSRVLDHGHQHSCRLATAEAKAGKVVAAAEGQRWW